VLSPLKTLVIFFVLGLSLTSCSNILRQNQESNSFGADSQNPDGSQKPDTVDAGPESCGPTSDSGSSVFRRLNRSEFNNTVNDLIGRSPETLNTDFVDDALGFDNNAVALSTNESHVEALLNASRDLSYKAILSNQVIKCSSGVGSDNCSREIIQNFAEKAYRRTLTSTEVDSLIQDGIALTDSSRETLRYDISSWNNSAVQYFRSFNIKNSDFDGDGKADIATYFPEGGLWHLSTQVSTPIFWGSSPLSPVPADYDGDGKTDLGLYNPNNGIWYIKRADGPILFYNETYGFRGTIPVPADYDGDGKAEVGVYDPATGKWYIKTLAGTVLADGVVYGANGGIPVPADYNGDGKTDLAVYYPSTGKWYARNLGGPIFLNGEAYGYAGVIPVPSDYNGNGKADLAVYDPANGKWFIKPIGEGVLVNGEAWGFGTTIPVPNDYTGDGKTDLAVYDVKEGHWYIRKVDGTRIAQAKPFGWSDATPILNVNLNFNGELSDSTFLGPIRNSISRILMSPSFIFHFLESDSIDEFSFASRLSYFLTSSAPDSTLFAAAKDGNLNEEAEISAQVDRLLSSEKARTALSKEFAGQWFLAKDLSLGSGQESLAEAMKTETALVFKEFIEENRDLRELLNPGFSYVNAELAQHYGISGVSSDEFQRVVTSERGSPLTQGGFLSTLKNPTARGNWVLKNLLCLEIAQPPENTMLVLPDLGPDATTREKVTAISDNPGCAACHEIMDPIGLGFGNFNAEAGFISDFDGKHIDASGTFSGENFADHRGLLQILENQEDIPQCMTEKLFTFALGRSLSEADKCAAKRISQEALNSEFTMKKLIQLIVQTEQFQNQGRE